MSQQQRFFDALQKNIGPKKTEYIQVLLDDMEEVVGSAMEEGVEKVSYELRFEEDSVMPRLEGEDDVASLELFSINTDGSVDLYFDLEVNDPHRDLYDLGEITDLPLNQSEDLFERTEGISISEFRDREELFLDILFDSLEAFAVDVSTFLTMEDEFEGRRQDLSLEEEDSEDFPGTEGMHLE